MKNKFTRFGCTLIVCLAMIACNESDVVLVIDREDPNAPGELPSTNDSIQLGDSYIYPLRGTLTNLPSENFTNGGQNYYCFVLKLEKLYPGHVIYPNYGEGWFDLSYSINFKFFTKHQEGPLDEEWSVNLLDELLPYYQPLDHQYAADQKAVAYLYGDRTLDPALDPDEYINYMKSQVRIKSGSMTIKKVSKNYLITFEGATESGEKVNCHFNDKITMAVDHQLERKENDFTTTTVPENYIQKGDKYYRLDDGFFYIFSPSTYEGKPLHTVQLISRRNYYHYEYNTYPDEVYTGTISQHWKSNALVLQFQFDSFHYFEEKNYQFTPSEGIYSVGYGLGSFIDVPFEGFPSDSLVIGYYHVATDVPNTFTYEEDPQYMENQVAIKSGQLEVSVHPSYYEFTGSFTDARGEEVKVKFKAVAAPNEYW